MKSNGRVVELLVRLINGDVLNKQEITDDYGISLRTWQRDLAYIREAVSESQIGEVESIDGTYRLARNSEEQDFKNVLAVSNIVLGSRALEKDEMKQVVEFLSDRLSPQMQEEMKKHLVIPTGSYTPLTRPKPLLKMLHDVSNAIINNRKLTFEYRSSQKGETKAQIHHAQPIALFFERYYFYVAMLSEEHDGYWMYRLDRMIEIKDHQSGDTIPYAERFSLQDHRNKTYLIDSGKSTTIRFIYYNHLYTALDNFPNSRVVRELPNNEGYEIEAEVKLEGAKLWLLGQGSGVEVLSPASLVKDMKLEMAKALAQYEKTTLSTRTKTHSKLQKTNN